MSDRETLFAVRLTWSAPNVLGGRQDLKREHVEHKFVEAGSSEEAITNATRTCSVYALDHGVKVEVIPVKWSRAKRSFAKYDGPAMNDNHTPTGAKLRVTPLG